MYIEFARKKALYTTRLSEWCISQGVPYYVINNTLWVNKGHIIQPLSPFYADIELSAKEALILIDKLDGGVVRWTTKKNKKTRRQTDWYIINKSYLLNLEELPEKTISNIHSGFNYCEVRPLDAKIASRDGHLIQTKVQKEHMEAPSMFNYQDDASFSVFASRDSAFEDIVSYFGVYFENRLIGLARCQEFNQTEVQISQMLLDPDYTKFKSREVLLWWVIRHYFEDKGFKSIVAGTRPLGPVSSEHDFILEQFLFEKTYMDLNVVFRNDIQYRVSMMRPFSRIASKISSNMRTYLALDKQKSSEIQ